MILEPIALTLLLAVPAPPPAGAAAALPQVAPAAAGGLFGRLDETTGRPLEAPSAGFADLPSWELEQAMRTDGADLLVESHADGTLTVDLDGRFHSAVFGRIDAAGRATIHHEAAALDAPAPR